MCDATAKQFFNRKYNIQKNMKAFKKKSKIIYNMAKKTSSLWELR